jgi:glycopeptide antibiotics resistance protein
LKVKIRQAQRIIFIIYVLIILYITIFSRNPGNEYIFKPLLWEYKKRMWHDIFLNILLFVPMGALCDVNRLWKKIACGFLLSVFVEILQYYFMLGYCELDDMLNNTIGTVLGCISAYIINSLWRRWRN